MKKFTASLFLMILNSTCQSLPQGFVYLKDIAPEIIQDMRYATANNFIGEPIPGYIKGRCIVSKQAGEQLRKAQEDIKKKGYNLKIYDCYRPQQAVNYFYRWSQKVHDQRQKAAYYPREEKKNLFVKKYIALYSGHSRGSTVDLTLVKRDASNTKPNKNPITACYDPSPNYLNDNSLDMGTRFDCLDKSANLHYRQLTAKQQANRLLLSQLMQRHGFKPYLYEWWHFTLHNEPYPHDYLNFPVQ